jgi:hypothetical protein
MLHGFDCALVSAPCSLLRATRFKNLGAAGAGECLDVFAALEHRDAKRQVARFDESQHFATRLVLRTSQTRAGLASQLANLLIRDRVRGNQAAPRIRSDRTERSVHPIVIACA